MILYDENWFKSCASIFKAIKTAQNSTLPNLHHCILDLIKMLKKLAALADVPAMRSVNHWARCLILGICHKCLRVLAAPHFAAAFLNAGFGRIPDLNEFIPRDKQWFTDGLNEVDYRTTHRCIKNDSNEYRPVWLPDGSSIRDAIIKMIANRLPQNPAVPPPPPPAPAVNGEDSSDDELGPNFEVLNNLPAPGGGANARGAGASVERVTRALLVYERYHKSYVN